LHSCQSYKRDCCAPDCMSGHLCVRLPVVFRMKITVVRLKNILLQSLPGETKAHAHQWFFTAACIHAALMIPLAILARYGYGPAALATPTGHAFEMLFGFAPALI